MIKSVTILGSTGSIGQQTIDVCSQYDIPVVGLACNRSVELFLEQIERCRPTRVAVADLRAAEVVRDAIRSNHWSVLLLAGPDAAEQLAASTEADMLVQAMVGMSGIKPVYAGLQSGHDIALANKEVLVAAGKPVLKLAHDLGRSINPIDSEHSAIWQCLRSGRPEELRRILLTASGGPFRGRTTAELEHVSPQDALKHPTWDMGAKITIDSASLMNKGLELIEAARLFDLSSDRIDVVVHPQSIIHSLVEWQDGSVIAQLGFPDMRLPIQYALGYTERWLCPERRFDPLDPRSRELTFEPVDHDTFPALQLAYRALDRDGSLPTVLNAANEIAVEAFLTGQIGFLEITRITEEMMAEHEATDFRADPDIEEILELDEAVRERTRERIQFHMR